MMADSISFNTRSAKEARASIDRLRRYFDRCDIPCQYSKENLTVDQQKQAIRAGAGRNHVMYLTRDIKVFVETELNRQDGGGSLITRKGLDMADQAVAAAEVLDKAAEVVETQLEKFNRVSDAAIAEAKKRVSQLSDYSNRLGVALNNLNKTLGDERMVCALANAEKLAAALALLDELEKKGSLQKVMAALNSTSASATPP